MSTRSICACCIAFGSGFTLKPMMMAFDAEASMTSVSVMVPTAPWITRTLISSVDRRSSASCSASTEPCTSPLRMTRSSLTSPASICLWRSARVTRALTVTFFSRS